MYDFIHCIKCAQEMASCPKGLAALYIIGNPEGVPTPSHFPKQSKIAKISVCDTEHVLG